VLNQSVYNSTVRFLDEFFASLDNLLDKHSNITKIKTIGDAYFAVAGLVNDAGVDKDDDNDRSLDNLQLSVAADNLVALIEFCLDVQDLVHEHKFRVVPGLPALQAALNASDVGSVMPDDDEEQQRSRAVVQEVFNSDGTMKIRVRIGVHCGDVVAGIVGRKQPVRVSGFVFTMLNVSRSNMMFGEQHAMLPLELRAVH
jgi:class 3 adenylate cyclase